MEATTISRRTIGSPNEPVPVTTKTIVSVLGEGNLTKACEVMRCSRATLYRWKESENIPWEWACTAAYLSEGKLFAKIPDIEPLRHRPQSQAGRRAAVNK